MRHPQNAASAVLERQGRKGAGGGPPARARNSSRTLRPTPQKWYGISAERRCRLSPGSPSSRPLHACAQAHVGASGRSEQGLALDSLAYASWSLFPSAPHASAPDRRPHVAIATYVRKLVAEITFKMWEAAPRLVFKRMKDGSIIESELFLLLPVRVTSCHFKAAAFIGHPGS